jgi:beta-lactamase superfamily II metal-dependent hydrolase
MLAIEMLPAGHGDALVVEYGAAGEVHQLLVDVGTVHAYDAVRARLLALPDLRYEAFVITHVDEDHIGGAVGLLDDPDLRHRVRDVWFNGYVHSDRGGDVLGPVDGERLTAAIVNGGYAWNRGFEGPVSPAVGGPIVVPSTGHLPTRDLPGGARVTFLSPSGGKLKRMAKVWRDVVAKAGLTPGAGTDRKARAPKPYAKHVPEPTVEQLADLAARTATDGSAANGASIAFVLEYEGARALLAADAHPRTLTSALERFARERGERRARFDLVKLPHHGSRANVTTGLVEAIDTSCYLVSSNGDTFGHPDDAAIARILASSGAPPRIFCNYDSPRTRRWASLAAKFGGGVVLAEASRPGLRVEAERQGLTPV